MRQERVLLAAVPAVDLVDEENRARAEGEAFLGVGDDLANALHALGDGAEGDELGLGIARDEARDGGLAAPGRAPEEDRAGVALLDRVTERAAGAEDVVLAGDFVERARAHARGEGRGAGEDLEDGGGGRFGFLSGHGVNGSSAGGRGPERVKRRAMSEGRRATR